MVDPNRLAKPGFEHLHGRVQARVVGVEDADTPVVRVPGYQDSLSIRLGQADAPETRHKGRGHDQRWGPEAASYARERLLGRTVTLDFGAETQWTYKRAVADVSVDGRSFAEDLVSRGLAKAAYGPSNRVVRAQRAAIQDSRGIWSDPNPVSPDTFRNRIVKDPALLRQYAEGTYQDRKMIRTREQTLHTAEPGSSVLDQVMPKLYDVQVNERTGTHQAWLMDPNEAVRKRALAKTLGVDPRSMASSVNHVYKQLLREVYGTDQDPDGTRARIMQDYERVYHLPTWGETSPLYAFSGGQYGDRGPIGSLLMHGAVTLDRHMNMKRMERYSMGNFYRPDTSSQTTVWEDAVGGLDAVTNMVLNSATYQFMALPMMYGANALRDALIHHGGPSGHRAGVLREAASAGNGMARFFVALADFGEKAQNKLFQHFTAPFVEDTLLPAAKVYDWILNKNGTSGLSHYVQKGIDALRDSTTSPAEKAILAYEHSEQAYRAGNMRPLGVVNRAMESIRIAVIGSRDVDGVVQAIGRAVIGQREWSTVPGAIRHGAAAAYQNLGYSSRVHTAPGGGRSVIQQRAGLTGFRGGSMIAIGGLVVFTLADYLIGKMDRQGRVDTGVQREVEGALNKLAIAAGRQKMHFLPSEGRGSDTRLGIIDPVWQLLKSIGWEKASALLPRLRLMWETTQGTNFAVAGSTQQASTLNERAQEAMAKGDVRQAQYLFGLARLSPNAAQVDGGAGMQSSSWAFQISPMPLLGTYNFAVRESFESDPATGRSSLVRRFGLGIQASVLIEAGTSFELPIMLREVWDDKNRRTGFQLAWDPQEQFTPLVSAATTAYGMYSIANVAYTSFGRFWAAGGGAPAARSLMEASGWVGKAAAAPFIIKALPATSVWFAARAVNAGVSRLVGWGTPAWGDMPSLVKLHENLRAGHTGAGYRFVRGAGRAAAVTSAAAVVASFATAVWGNNHTQAASVFFKGLSDNVMSWSRHLMGDIGEGMARAVMTYFPYYYPNHADAGKVMRKDPFGNTNVGAQKAAFVTPGTWFQRQVIDPLSKLFSIDLAQGKVGPLYVGTGARFMSVGPFGVAERSVTRDEKTWGTLYAQIGIMPFQPGTAMQLSRAVTTVMRNTDPGKFDTRYFNDLLSGAVDPELKGRRVLERKSPIVLGTMWHPDSPVFDTQSMATSFEVRRRMAMADWIRHVDGYDVFAYREDPRMLQWRRGNPTFSVSMGGRANITMKFANLLKFLKGEDMQGNFMEADDDSMAASPMSDVIHGRPAAAKAATSALLSAWQDKAMTLWAAAAVSVGIVGALGLGAAAWNYREGMALRLRQHGTHVPRSSVLEFGPVNKFMTGAGDVTRGFMFGIGTRAYVNRVPHGPGVSPLLTREEAQTLHSIYSNARGLWEKASRPSAVVTRGRMLHTATEMATLLKFMRQSGYAGNKETFMAMQEVKNFLRMFHVWDRKTHSATSLAASVSVPDQIQQQFERAGNAIHQHLLRDFHDRFNLQIASPGMHAQVYGGGGFKGFMMRLQGLYMGIVDDLFNRNGFAPVSGGPMTPFTEAWNNAASRAAARRFSVSPSSMADFQELYRLNAAAMRSGGPSNMFDYVLRQKGIPVSQAEIDHYQKSFRGRVDTANEFVRNRAVHYGRKGLGGIVKGLGQVAKWGYTVRTGVSSVYMGSSMLDTSLSRDVRIQMGGGAFTELVEFGILTVGATLLTAGAAALLGAVGVPAALIGGLAAATGVVGSMFLGVGFGNLVGESKGWKNFTRDVARRVVDWQDRLGTGLRNAVSSFGSVFRNMTEAFQDMADSTINSFLKSNAPDWAKGAAETTYQFVLRPLSDRALQYFNPNEAKQSLSAMNPLFRQGPIWHGNILEAGLGEVAAQERVRLGSQSGALYSLYPQSYFGMVGRDERLEIPLRSSVGAANFFKPANLVDEILADQMRARAVSYQMALGKLLNRREALQVGKGLFAIMGDGQQQGPRIDPEAYRLYADRSTTKGQYIERVREAALAASKRTGVRAALIMAVARQESSLQQFATNSKTISGLMQISQETGKDAARRLGLKDYKHSRDAFDINTNLLLGADYLKVLLKKYRGNERYAVIAYHIGEGAMDKRLQSGNLSGTAVDGADPLKRADVIEAYAAAEDASLRELVQRKSQPAPNAGTGSAKPATVTTIVVPNAKPPAGANDPAARNPQVPMGERRPKRNPDGSVTVPKRPSIGTHQVIGQTSADTTPPSNAKRNQDTAQKGR